MLVKRQAKQDSFLDAIGHTPLVEFTHISPNENVRIFGKLEAYNPTGSLKDRIVKYMLNKAEESGELTPDKIILEATSGNTGIALAMIGKRKGYKVHVVLPENVSQEVKQLLLLYGAETICSEGSRGTNGAIELAHQLAKDPRYYMPYQYGNPANPLAHYETTGVEILDELPQVDVFIAGLGTGGTLMGVGRRLKELNPETRIYAVVPQVADRIHGLRSLDEGFVPPILDLSLLDGRFVVDSKDAFRATKELTVREGIFVGVSSGAVVHCARRIAQRMRAGNIVCLLADGGWKYLSTGLWSRDICELGEEIDSKIWW